MGLHLSGGIQCRDEVRRMRRTAFTTMQARCPDCHSFQGFSSQTRAACRMTSPSRAHEKYTFAATNRKEPDSHGSPAIHALVHRKTPRRARRLPGRLPRGGLSRRPRRDPRARLSRSSGRRGLERPHGWAVLVATVASQILGGQARSAARRHGRQARNQRERTLLWFASLGAGRERTERQEKCQASAPLGTDPWLDHAVRNVLMASRRARSCATSPPVP